ncbi:hypothetical protein FNU76_22045 [Chitinimonas arctica]|uniref:Uncharacterized protein n=1 Tax=Chitinimonas arctica TaxID=2594795 RepID=A0A516SKY7_9NEIS|nr:hypothetical protein [Chitinimonas arctica]QDQ28816.1 hypothetical protein FNU76_22045 [Chitinimonas arctica]
MIIPPAVSAPAAIPSTNAVPMLSPTDGTVFAPIEPLFDDGGASIVDLSRLGRLESAASVIESLAQPAVLSSSIQPVGVTPELAGLDPQASPLDRTAASAADPLTELLPAAQRFVEAFNDLQTQSLADADGAIAYAPRAPVERRGTEPLDRLPFEPEGLDGVGANAQRQAEQPALARLAELGIVVQEPLDAQSTATQLGLDIPTLRSALQNNPQATSAALAESAQVISQLAADAADENRRTSRLEAESAAQETIQQADLFADTARQNDLEANDANALLQRQIADNALNAALQQRDALSEPAPVRPDETDSLPVSNRNPAAEPDVIAAQRAQAELAASRLPSDNTILPRTLQADNAAAQTPEAPQADEPQTDRRFDRQGERVSDTNSPLPAERQAITRVQQPAEVQVSEGVERRPPLGAADFNRNQLLAGDPAIAAAVAAFHLGERGFLASGQARVMARQIGADRAVVPVVPTQAVELDLQNNERERSQQLVTWQWRSAGQAVAGTGLTAA